MLLAKIETVINDDITFQKSGIGLRNQRCFAVKVCLVSCLFCPYSPLVVLSLKQNISLDSMVF